MVWLHHFFTMGAGGDVNAIFGITTMIIAVPTGVKVFNWLFTMYGGRVTYSTPMMFSIGFMVTFVIGGMTGVLLAVPPADFALHNSLFLVAHFHNVIIGGVLFGAFAGYNFWFPKAFGFRLHERLGQGVVLVLAGRLLRGVHAALCTGPRGHDPAHAALRRRGLAAVADRGRGRRAGDAGRHPVHGRAAGDLASATGTSWRDLTGDPWDGRSLEWATASPPPAFNFAVLPHVEGEEPYWGIKERAREQLALGEEPEYEEIEIPRNSADRLRLAFFATIMGFALIWHIWWMVAGGVGAFATFVVFAWRDRTEEIIPAEEVARIDRANRAARAAYLETLKLETRRCRHERVHADRWRGVATTPTISAAAAVATGSPTRNTPPAGLASKRIIVGYGFWIFLLSDIIMFSAFFATYAVLSGATDGGPSGKDLFDLHNAAIETACLLLSSFTCGLASIAASRRQALWFYGAMAATCGLGPVFLGWSSTSSWTWWPRARARSAARSCPPSSPWSAATACTCRSASCGC